MILGGRGAGKTRAGAEWIRSRVEGSTPLGAGVARRVALVGETLEQARGVMVEGDSGLLACSPPDRRPRLIASQHKLVWPNGAEAAIVSATSYESLRGPQFDTAWSDELAKWRHAREAWDMLQFTLRLGADPRQIVTTTPRDNAGAGRDPGPAGHGRQPCLDRGEPGQPGAGLHRADGGALWRHAGWGARSWTAS